LNLLDRQAVLESNFNWRVHGLPARIENIRLEQLPLLSTSGDTQEALGKLRQEAAPSINLVQQFFAKTQQNAAIFYVSSTHPDVNNLISEQAPSFSFEVEDTSDLFFVPPNSSEKKSGSGSQKVFVPVIDAAARLTKPEFDLVWLDHAIERLTPIQIQVLLIRAKKGLKQKGRCAGVFVDYEKSDAGVYWANPTRLRPLTRAAVHQYAANAGFSDVTFSDDTTRSGLTMTLYELN
jgi:hypothetical protein